MYAFIHIPKTAGTSIKSQLLGAKPQTVLNVVNQTTFDKSFDQNPEQLAGIRDRYNGLVGHIVYREWWAANIDVIVSVIREPVERAISLTNFIRSTPENNLYDVVNDLGFKAAFQENPRFRNLLCNSQYRALFGGGAESMPDFDEATSPAEIEAHFDEKFSAHKYIVGTLKGLGSFCAHFNECYNTTLSTDVKKKTRVETDDYVFDDADLQAIRDSNRIDILLYAYVLKKTIVVT